MTTPYPLEQVLMGQLILAGELSSSLPLEETHVSGQITGPIAVVTVTQRFGNPLSEPAELEYLFPLPHTAAIVGFELQAGNRTLRGELQELEQARQAYERARDQGRRTGLLEARRPNLFAIKLANVLPGEVLLAKIRYQDHLEYRDGEYEFVFPMGLTPRYHSPSHSEEGHDLDAPVALPGEPVGPVEISLSIDAGMSAGELTSPSHPLEVTRLDERRFNVQLAGDHIPNHDFVLRYPVHSDQPVLAAWTSPADGEGDFFMANLLPPLLDETARPEPREYVFVLDRSGSMSGEPVAQARNALRACLRVLNPEDRFWILLFDDQLEWFWPEPAAVTQEIVNQADAYLARVEGRGGTEIVAALTAALTLPALPDRTRLVVFLTDGAVSAEERAYEEVRRQLGPARLFTFGIGPSVNRALLSRLAQLGHGTAEFLQLEEDIEGAILRFQDRVAFPALTDLTLSWEGGKVWDVYPTHLPDLYVGQPLLVTGRLKPSRKSAVSLGLRGQRGGQAVELHANLPITGQLDQAVARSWARARLDDLLERLSTGGRETQRLRNEIIGLALEYQMVTPYTAFVAVDLNPAVTDGKPRKIAVSQPLPDGLNLAGFTGALAPKMFAPGLQAAAPTAFSRSLDALPPVDDLSIPSFLRRRGNRPAQTDGESGLPAPVPDLALPVRRAVDDLPPIGEFTPEAGLRWLARTQNMDGSWGTDLEWTAAALLAFVRHGHTTRTGSYRRQVQRAWEWLSGAEAAAPASGFPAFLRVLALTELAENTRQAVHIQVAQAAVAALPAPVNPLEREAWLRLQQGSQPGALPNPLITLDDLRLAAVSRSPGVVIPGPLLSGAPVQLVRTLAACIL